jgi:hypothetical protein
LLRRFCQIASGFHYLLFARFEVFTAVNMDNAVFLDVASYRSCKLNRRFGGMCRLHLQGRKIRNVGSIHKIYTSPHPRRRHYSFYFVTIFPFCRSRSSDFRPTPDLEDQVPVFMFPSDMVAQLQPQAPDFLFVAFYDSHGDGGGILTRLHTG